MFGVFTSGVGEARGRYIGPRQGWCSRGGAVSVLSTCYGNAECCKLPQWGPWQSQNIFRCVFSPVEAICWKQFLSKTRHCLGTLLMRFMCHIWYCATSLQTVTLIHNKNDACQILALNFAVLKRPRHPLVTALVATHWRRDGSLMTFTNLLSDSERILKVGQYLV